MAWRIPNSLVDFHTGADGLAFHEASQTLVASCPGGVCLVDLDAGEVVAKMHLGRSVSNVAFGGGFAWITADKSLWRVELREERRDRRRREL
jgi:sugar lactone lactonase YvrE